MQRHNSGFCALPENKIIWSILRTLFISNSLIFALLQKINFQQAPGNHLILFPDFHKKIARNVLKVVKLLRFRR